MQTLLGAIWLGQTKEVQTGKYQTSHLHGPCICCTKNQRVLHNSRVFLVCQLFRQIFKLIVNIDFFYEIFLRLKPKLYKKFQYKDWSEMKMTKVFSKISLVKSSKNNFIFLPVFYLIMCLMKAQKNFGKIAILKTWELVSLGGAKTHFGKIALK